MYRDGYSNFGFFNAVQPRDVTAGAVNIAGDTIDARGYDSLVFIVALGLVSYVSTASYILFRMQHASESAAGIDAWADVPLENMIFSGVSAYTSNSGAFLSICPAAAALSASQGSTQHAVGYRGNKRYVRLYVSSVSTPGSWAFGAVAVLGQPPLWPVNAT
ncbi:MAG: hypothetical protein C4575_09255 [Desulforudis sp.]|jgi:hypothetical protein|nr:MAG: hypothetical protein C4575_09255 [Desulforudis sp.]